MGNDDASKLYSVDTTAVALNAVIAFFTSTVSSLGVYAVTDGVHIAMLVFGFTFVPAFLTKVVAEHARRRSVVQAQRRAYKRGAERSEPSGTNIMGVGAWWYIYALFDRLTYWPSGNTAVFHGGGFA